MDFGISDLMFVLFKKLIFVELDALMAKILSTTMMGDDVNDDALTTMMG